MGGSSYLNDEGVGRGERKGGNYCRWAFAFEIFCSCVSFLFLFRIFFCWLLTGCCMEVFYLYPKPNLNPFSERGRSLITRNRTIRLWIDHYLELCISPPLTKG